MKSPRFDYLSPRTLSDAVTMLAEAPPASRVLAGGQSLMPILNRREARPPVLVDLRRVEGLDRIEVRDDHVAVGAMTRHHAVEHSALLADLVPLLPRSIGKVAYPTVRNQGTTGGSLAHADFRAEHPAVALTLDATLVLASVDGVRLVPAADFFVGHQQTSIGEREILIEVRYPLFGMSWRWDMDEFLLRYRDFAIVACYAGVALEGGRVRRCRLTIGACDPVPLRLHDLERRLVGAELTPAVIDDVAAEAARASRPAADRFGGPQYRRELIRTYVRRVLAALSPMEGTR